MRSWVVLVAAVAGAGGVRGASAPVDPAAVMALLHRQDQALLDVGERLAVGARRFCPAGGWSAGLAVQRLDQYGADYRAAAAQVLGIGERATVAVIAPRSAAAAAGLREGDQLIAVDGQRFAAAPATRSVGDYDGIAADQARLDAALADGRAEFTVQRAGRPVSLALVARPACPARFEVRAGRTANASADGTIVQLASDLIADAHGSDELAAIAAHELSHNILRHPQRLKAHEAGLSVRTTEIQADRLSVYLLDAAGFPPAAAAAFWGRWGRAHDLGILSDRTHPGWQKRVALIEQEAAAVAAARAAGRPVEPPADLRPPA